MTRIIDIAKYERGKNKKVVALIPPHRGVVFGPLVLTAMVLFDYLLVAMSSL